jgi:predicted  nucleic acid-binding Zn-ribbon protein
MAGAGFSLDELRLELARNEHQLSELEVILADYTSERARLVRDISHMQTRLREAEEEMLIQSRDFDF